MQDQYEVTSLRAHEFATNRHWKLVRPRACYAAVTNKHFHGSLLHSIMKFMEQQGGQHRYLDHAGVVIHM